MVATSKTVMTAEQLLERSSELGRCELVRGELILMSPAGAEHGRITMEIARLIANHAEQHRLGEVYSAETGFVLEHDPDTVREADVPFVRAQRLPDKPNPGFFEGAPDLVVEVLSPDDRASEVAQKIELWLDKGARLVWVVDPKRRTVTVHRDPKHARTLHENHTLDGEAVLPGFSIRVGQIFD